MKTKLKGQGGIKGLFLLHGEKIAIVVVGLLAMWFVYSSLQLPSLEDQYQASSLQQQVTQTNQSVTESRWPEADSDVVRNFKPIAKNANWNVKPADYPITPFDLPVIAPTLLRDDPLVLNAVEVRAIGGSGLLAFRDAQTLKEQERRRRLAEDEQQKKAREQQERQDQQPQGPEGGRREGRGRGGPEGAEFGTTEFDPEHPDRRLIEGMTTPAGVPIQGGERIERAYWATVVAKVPIREQLKLYQDAFVNARGGFDPSRDFPRYVGYVVERAEIVDGKVQPWQRVNLFDCQRKSLDAKRHIERGVTEKAVGKLYEIASIEWAGMPIEPVDDRYRDTVLTLPLPPLVGRDFGADATHPDIPLAINAPPLEQEVEPLAEQPNEQPAEEDGELEFGTSDSTPMIPGAGLQGRMSVRSPYSGGEFGERGMRPSFSPRGEFSPEGGGSRIGSYSGGMSAGQKTTLPRGVDFWLLRFMDYTVQPGKKYKYRVKVVLADPNYGVERSYLGPAVLDRKVGPARYADDWSDPSPTVGIPLGGTAYVAEAKPLPKLHNDEPTVRLWAETFDIDKEGTAIHVAQDGDFHRGAVINLEDKMLYTGEGDRWRDTFDSYKLHTGITLLDLDGADSLPGKDMAAPTRVLLMDAAGELSIRNEMDDSMIVEELQFLFTEDKRRGRQEEGEMPFGPGGGFRGPPGRGRGR